MGRTKKEHREAAAARRKRLARPAKAPDPSQNLHVERGAPVTLGEVRAFALDGHPECRSRPGLGRDGRPCKCATRRFFAKHPEVIVDASGNAWWPASVKPVVGPKPSMSAEPEKHAGKETISAHLDRIDPADGRDH